MSTAEAERPAEVLIVTGMSGAGRSTVAKALEDLDWYVVQNIPPHLLEPLLDTFDGSSGRTRRFAVIVDVREQETVDALPGFAQWVKASRQARMLFLDASDEVLVRRFEAVRRPQPFNPEGTLLRGIQKERQLLDPARASADLVIDTSKYTVHQLSSYITELFSAREAVRHTMTVLSFGFKYGLPMDADNVTDMRFLPNPYWDERLRSLTGCDQPVRDFVLSQNGVHEFLDSYTETLRLIISGYFRENKRHSTTAIGCTGGKHRSVAMSRALAERLAALPDLAVTVSDRDLGRE